MLCQIEECGGEEKAGDIFTLEAHVDSGIAPFRDIFGKHRQLSRFAGTNRLCSRASHSVCHNFPKLWAACNDR